MHRLLDDMPDDIREEMRRLDRIAEHYSDFLYGVAEQMTDDRIQNTLESGGSVMGIISDVADKAVLAIQAGTGTVFDEYEANSLRSRFKLRLMWEDLALSLERSEEEGKRPDSFVARLKRVTDTRMGLNWTAKKSEHRVLRLVEAKQG